MSKRHLTFLVIMVLFVVYNNAWAQYRYHPQGCEFSVEFPDRPEFTDIFFPGLGEIESAQYVAGHDVDDVFFLRAQCIPIPESAPMLERPKKYLTQAVQEYAKWNGIQYAEISYSEKDKTVKMRGFKKLEEAYVTFEAVAKLGSASLIMLYVGSASKIFPTTDIAIFLLSLREE